MPRFRLSPRTNTSLFAGLTTSVVLLFSNNALAEHGPAEVRIGFSKESQETQVIRRFGWAEQEFAKSGTRVQWIALEDKRSSFRQLDAGAVDILVAPASAALAARAQGMPVRAIATESATNPTEPEVMSATEAFVEKYPTTAERLARLKIRAAAWLRKQAAEVTPSRNVYSKVQDASSNFAADAHADIRRIAATLAASGVIKTGTDTDALVDQFLLREPVARVAALYPNGTTR